MKVLSPTAMRRASSTVTSPSTPPNRLAYRSKSESPRIPLRLSPKFKSIALSPLVDERSPLSLPESDHDRVRWLNRFTPRWNETREERLARFKLRAQNMRSRRAHTEKLLNSFQRLDVFTGTVLPSDLMISFSFSKWHPSPENSQPTESGKGPTQSGKNKKTQEDGPGTYLTPNRILHPYWVSKNNAMSVWAFCHQDVLKHRKKLRSLYRFTQEPKFSPYLGDQISSQLARRIAQECVVLKHALAPVSCSTPTVLDQLIANKAPLGTMPMMSNYPTLSSSRTLMEYVELLLEGSMKPVEVNHQAKPEKASRLSTTLGGIVVMSSKLFRQLLQLNNSKLIDSNAEPPQDESDARENQSTLMFSLSSPDGPVPVWDVEALLQTMAKQPPRKPSDSLITAEINRSTKIPNESSLAEILKNQIDDALNYSNKQPSSSHAQNVDEKAYLIPLTEPTYPLILSLRRATWWLGQGFELDHFSHIQAMVQEATDRRNKQESDWLNWLRNKQTFEGRIRGNGRLGRPKNKNNKLR